jgi:hypothetical protein
VIFPLINGCVPTFVALTKAGNRGIREGIVEEVTMVEGKLSL